MLKHPFNKVMSISEDGREVWVLMMGHYTPDAIAALPEAIDSAAQSIGMTLPEDYRTNLLYTGPDEVPIQWFAVLTSGNLARVFNVTDGRNSHWMVPSAYMYIEIMEDAQNLLQAGMKEDEATFICWKNIYAISQETPQIADFVRCFQEFKRDIVSLHLMLKEEKMIPPKPKRRKKKAPYDPYEELGLDPKNFF